MNKIFVHHRSGHHGINSGYGKLIDYLDANVVYGKTRFPYRFWKFLAYKHSQNAGIYDAGGMLKTIELYNLLKKNKNKNNIVHFLNGERDVRHLGLLKWRFPNTVFCATFHKPPETLKRIITDNTALKKLDGAIAVGANQVKFLKEWLDIENVVYIPHGVDTRFFKPNDSVKKKDTLLFVGQHLRDFETFNKTIPKLATAIKNLCVNVVIHQSYIDKVEHHDCLNIFTQVDDEVLRLLYQESTALYLPMLDGTACNSILEALACGLPVITNEVGSNAVYLDETSSLLCQKGDGYALVQTTTALLKDEVLLTEISRLSRERALTLDWDKVANEINNFYGLLIKRIKA